jgi:hypothetical protein
MAERRPSVFIGSSSEGLPITKAIQLNLDRACEVVPWSQGIFGLGGGTLETLVDKAGEFDFAILVVTPDDMIESRGHVQQSPRDNVLLELGIFIGVIGRKRTMVVFDRIADVKLPSDLAGVTLADYQLHSSGNLEASLGAACTRIETTIKELGLRERLRVDFNIDQNTQFQVISDLLDASALQFMILMHEQNVTLRKESMFERGLVYTFARTGRESGHGSFSVSSLCKKLPDAGLLQPDLRDDIRLTSRGHQFADWLIERGHKMDYFESTVGGWGERPSPSSAGMDLLKLINSQE